MTLRTLQAGVAVSIALDRVCFFCYNGAVAHCVVEAAEDILDRRFSVLDKGFVRLIDYLGGDARIVQAARVSYGAGTRTARDDAALIDFLLRNKHTSPFEQVVLTFHVRAPIFVARQWMRHRTARISEVSGRYSLLSHDCYVPQETSVAVQSTRNKQGRASEGISPEQQQEVRAAFEAQQKAACAAYDALIQKNIARELARINVPLSLYTEWYWQIDLHNLFHFLRLRASAHAQAEIRAYAEVIIEITRAVAPCATASFENHEKDGVQFSGREFAALKALLAGEGLSLEGKERARFEEKLRSGLQQ
ncbi:thymidylate synthase (FAD) [Treponema paraluiscuniculi Cuniculi A]|uniref:Flavin-dependent thymidylate synthase n=2 Tax=Treponema paraluiscuniculi TaxID=53435 RepID=F7XR79_TREPU|nr:FAD-dependent thymidylate synthase [Treponema paraluiscuniculi]AEH40931.1 thymidylate synthase (FAD) [Treponema paraluiscuniculi Cuniculi A]WKC72860.1 thymidylate synthase (FAD) [Treponema paraluiscuniculi]